jgi:hypothetical protein
VVVYLTPDAVVVVVGVVFLAVLGIVARIVFRRARRRRRDVRSG